MRYSTRPQGHFVEMGMVLIPYMFGSPICLGMGGLGKEGAVPRVLGEQTILIAILGIGRLVV
jgi:hypothetical protein